MAATYSDKTIDLYNGLLKRLEFAPMYKPTVTYYWPGMCKLRMANVFLKEGRLGRSSITSIECSEHNKHSQITSQIM